MQGVDHCINGFAARLMYKAADKAMGVEKTKEQAEGKREIDTQACMLTAARVRTDMG